MFKERRLLDKARTKCDDLVQEIRQTEHNTKLTRILAIQKMNLINEIRAELYE